MAVLFDRRALVADGWTTTNLVRHPGYGCLVEVEEECWCWNPIFMRLEYDFRSFCSGIRYVRGVVVRAHRTWLFLFVVRFQLLYLGLI